MNKSEIKFTVQLDENKLPNRIDWESSEEGEKSECKSIMLALWDNKESNTLRIDLWTKDMLVDEMKIFFHQTILSMANTFERATEETAMAGDMKDFAIHFAEKMKLQNQ